MSGAYPAPLAHVAKILVSLCLPEAWRPIPSWSATETTIVTVIRLPRLLLAGLAGGGLGLAGASLQGMMRNPLVGPDLIGISSGAACGGMIAILFDWPERALRRGFLWRLPGAHLRLDAGARIGRRRRAADPARRRRRLGFLYRQHGLIEYTADAENKLPTLVTWLIGSFAAANAHKMALLAPPVAFAGGALLLLRWRINLLSLDDEDAEALGQKTVALR